MHVTVVTLTLILAYVACKIIMVILIPFFFCFCFCFVFFFSFLSWFISLIDTYIFLFSENRYIFFFQATVAFPGIPIFVVLLVLDANIDKLVSTSDASITQNKV